MSLLDRAKAAGLKPKTASTGQKTASTGQKMTTTGSAPSLLDRAKASGLQPKPAADYAVDKMISEMKAEGEYPIREYFRTTGTGKFGTTLGTAVVAGSTTKDIGQANVSEAESRLQLSKMLNRPDVSEEQKANIRKQLSQPVAVPTAEKQVPELSKTAGQVFGEGASTLGTALVGAAAPATAVGRIVVGTAIGGLTGLGSSLEEKKSAADVAKSTAIGAGTGLAISGAVEGISAAFKAIAKSSAVQKFTGKIYNHELQPPTKEVAADIERGFKTFGEKARDIVDDSGNPVYVGNYETLFSKSKEQINKQGSRLLTKASELDDKVAPVFIDDIGQKVLTDMEETFGILDENQVNKIINEASRVPKQMNLTEMVGAKRKYDSLIPDNYWLNAGDANTNFIAQVRYAYRDALRKAIDAAGDSVGDSTIKTLNNDLTLAMDMKKLTATQLAMRQTQKLPWFKAFQRLVDDTILSPAITTRVSQTIKKSGETVPAGKSALIKGSLIKVASGKLQEEKSD